MPLSEFSLEDKVAIVTGGSRGLGEGISLAMAEAGADIVIAARTAGQVEAIAEKISQTGRRCLPITTDVTSAEQVNQMVEKTLTEFGKIDILVNNAGTTIIKPLVVPSGFESKMSKLVPDFNVAMTQEEWHRVLDTNLTSVFLCCQAVGPHMISRKQGKIINISSLGARRGSAYRVGYTASKAGVSMLTKSLALEWAKYNINVNAIAPGSVATALTAYIHQSEKAREGLIRSIPLHRLGEPRDIGLLSVYLASAASSYVTGETIFVDGGANI
ncbi:SDR family NAD(P)-dependent oxidoreductase [Chloroflexota bacterium]